MINLPSFGTDWESIAYPWIPTDVWKADWERVVSSPWARVEPMPISEGRVMISRSNTSCEASASHPLGFHGSHSCSQ